MLYLFLVIPLIIMLESSTYFRCLPLFSLIFGTKSNFKFYSNIDSDCSYLICLHCYDGIHLYHVVVKEYTEEITDRKMSEEINLQFLQQYFFVIQKIIFGLYYKLVYIVIDNHY